MKNTRMEIMNIQRFTIEPSFLGKMVFRGPKVELRRFRHKPTTNEFVFRRDAIANGSAYNLDIDWWLLAAMYVTFLADNPAFGESMLAAEIEYESGIETVTPELVTDVDLSDIERVNDHANDVIDAESVETAHETQHRDSDWSSQESHTSYESSHDSGGYDGGSSSGGDSGGSCGGCD